MEKYTIIEISVPEEAHDLFYSVAAEWPCDVFWEEGDVILTSISEHHFNAEVRAGIEADIRPFGWTATFGSAESENWNKVWEVNFQPVEVDSFVRIRAPFHEPVGGFKHEILMEPKMAFGTGHHETTYMMIKLMEELDFAGREVWDFGCGTAVLGIVAALEGAVYVFANDIEKPAVASSIDNAVANGVVIHVEEGGIETVKEAEAFDVIIANITRNVLLASSDEIKRKMKPGGILLLSGILIEDIPLITSDFGRHGLILQKTLERGKWAALRLDYPE